MTVFLCIGNPSKIFRNPEIETLIPASFIPFQLKRKDKTRKKNRQKKSHLIPIEST